MTGAVTVIIGKMTVATSGVAPRLDMRRSPLLLMISWLEIISRDAFAARLLYLCASNQPQPFQTCMSVPTDDDVVSCPDIPSGPAISMIVPVGLPS